VEPYRAGQVRCSRIVQNFRVDSVQRVLNI